MWLIASISFWTLGGLFMLGAIAAVPCRKPQETMDDAIRSALLCLSVAGVLFFIAAKIAS